MQEYFLCVQWILCENRLTQRRKERGVCPYMRKSCTQKSQNFAPHASAKVCAVCVRQFFSAGILCLLCDTTPRKDAKGAELYVFLFFCQKVAHRNHRKPQNFAPHASAKVCAVCVRP